MAFTQFSSAQSRKVEKAFEALWMYDYFKAREVFQKTIDKEYCASTFGLSLVYGQEKSPFQQIDSAYNYVLLSDSSYRYVNEKERIELNGLDINGVTIKKQKNTVSKMLFERVLKEGRWERYQDFIDSNQWSTLLDTAIALRDESAYSRASDTNTFQSFQWFIEGFPKASQIKLAQAKYDSLFYLDFTKEKTLDAYQRFLFEYPDSPQRAQAEIEVFSKGVDAQNPESFYLFIVENPESPYLGQAWENYYRYSVKYGTVQEYEAFINTHPQSPLVPEATEALALAKEYFFPFQEGEKWGFVNQEGQVRIEAQYNWVSSFNEGKAAVGMDNLTGYITKQNDTLIKPLFDEGEKFVNGIARVEMNEQYQLIDYKGDFLTNTWYNDLGVPSENRCYVAKGFYGFIEVEGGQEVIPLLYDNAYDFKNGVAIVEREGLYGLIDQNGDEFLNFDFEAIELGNDSIIRLKKEGKWAAFTFNADTILPFEYSYIGSLSDELILVLHADSTHYSYVNKQGEKALDGDWDVDETTPIYANFENGVARFKKKGVFGLIDTAGAKIYPALFDAIGSFDSTLTPIRRYGKWGFANAQVKLEIKYQYTYAEGFDKGLAKVERDGKMGFIDATGTEIIPVLFEKAERLKPDLFLLEEQGKLGLLNVSGDTLIPFIGTDHLVIEDQYLVILNKTNRLIYDLKGQKFIFNQLKGVETKQIGSLEE